MAHTVGLIKVITPAPGQDVQTVCRHANTNYKLNMPTCSEGVENYVRHAYEFEEIICNVGIDDADPTGDQTAKFNLYRGTLRAGARVSWDSITSGLTPLNNPTFKTARKEWIARLSTAQDRSN